MKRSPAAALWLSACPGIGHIYLGLPMKGLVLILLVASAMTVVDRVSDAFVPVVIFFWIGGAIDAYRTARETNHLIDTGQQLAGVGTTVPLAKWWGWVLIGLGILFFLDNFDVFHFDWLVELWPLAFIGLGVYILKRPEPAFEPKATPPLPETEPPAEEPVGLDPDAAVSNVSDAEPEIDPERDAQED